MVTVKRKLILSAIAALSIAGPAHASGAAMVVAAISSLGQSIINTVMNSMMTGTMVPLVMKSTATVQGEIAKSTQAQIQAQAAIAEYQTNLHVKQAAAKIKESSKVPDDTCTFIEGVDTLKSANGTATRDAAVLSGKFGAGLSSSNRNTVVDMLHKTSLDKYATEVDRQRYGTRAKESALPGADINGAYLFGNKEGRPTYDVGQEDAVKMMISRKTILSIPEPLDARTEQTPEGRTYEEYRKRLASFLSNAQVSYLSIMNGYRQSDGGAPSVMEIAEGLINGRFSSKNIAANASRLEPGPILKDIAMMNSMQLWLDLRTLKNQEKMVAMLADQQVMMAESVVTQKAEDLRAAAMKLNPGR